MKKITITFLMISFVIASCKKETVQPTTPTITENYNPPSNNSSIIEQFTTNTSTFNSILKMIPATNIISDNNIIYYGNESTNKNIPKYVLKKQSTSGIVIWSNNIDMYAYSMKNLSTINPMLDDIYCLIGGKDNNGDGTVENASISTFDKNGTLISTKINADPNYSTCFVTSLESYVIGCDTLRMYVMGYGIKNNIYYPFIKSYNIDDNGNIREGIPCGDIPITEGIDINQPNKYYSGATNYYLTLKGTATNSKLSYLQKVDIGNVFSPTWEKQIDGNIGTNNISTDGSNYYICGSEDDNSMAVGSSNYIWQNAILYKYNSSGSQLWKAVVKCSDNDKNYDDIFNDVIYSPINNSTYCVGKHSTFSKDGISYGNGLISKINSNTGMIEYSYSIGDKTYSSSLNSILSLGGNIYSSGYTNYKNTASGYKTWFVKTNL